MKSVQKRLQEVVTFPKKDICLGRFLFIGTLFTHRLTPLPIPHLGCPHQHSHRVFREAIGHLGLKPQNLRRLGRRQRNSWSSNTFKKSIKKVLMLLLFKHISCYKSYSYLFLFSKLTTHEIKNDISHLVSSISSQHQSTKVSSLTRVNHELLQVYFRCLGDFSKTG